MAPKTMDTLYKRANEKVRYVKGHQVIATINLTKQSEKNKSTTLKLTSNTRWAGVVIMFDSLLEGTESFQEMAISQSADVDSPIQRILLDYVFWGRVVSSLKPIAVAIARTEGALSPSVRAMASAVGLRLLAALS